MTSSYLRILTFVIISFSCGLITGVHAQVDKKHGKQYISVEWEEQLLSMLDEQLAQASKVPLHFYFLEKIEAHCQEDLDCQWDSYWVVMDELNALKLHLQCIPLTEKLIELAKAREDEEGEISALWKLNRFNIFMEDFERETQIHLKLLEIYEKKGDVGSVLYLKTLLAEDKALYLNQVDEAIAEMKELVARAKELDVPQKNVIIRRLYLVYQELDMRSALPEVLKELEKIPISDPPELENIAYLSGILTGRALLAWEAKDYDQAEALFLKDLEINKTRFDGKGDIWYDIDIKHRLARMEWERGNKEKAEAILEETYEGAVAFQLHDQIRENLRLRTAWAEETNRYADALKYTRAFYAHEEQLDSVFAEFDAQRFYTQLANERLQSEKESQALELILKNNQLLIVAFAGLLVLLLAAGLLIGYRQQQKRRKELHQQNLLIQEQAEQLKVLDQAKTRFFANVSHELRTPLTLILGPVNTLLQENQLTARQTKLLKMADKSGEKLKQLIGEILDLRKLELSIMEVNPQPTSIATFFSSHLAQFESLVERNAIDFSIDIAVAEQVVADLDREKCRQIIANLLSNAFKFTPPGGQINAAVSLYEEVFHLSVTDTGSGIHPDDLPHIFDRYFQTNRPEKPIEGGTGIGLAICQEYANLFGGTITVESEMNKGTTFALSFPVRLVESTPQPVEQDLKRPYFPAEERLPTTEKTIPQSSNQQRPSILVVEDNPDLSDYLKLILSEKYEVVTAQNGQIAWDYILPGDGKGPARDFQLILSDLMMPVMDGFQLLEKLKATDATRHIPVVMLTARADVRDKLKALRIGVDDYLLKPFEEEELMVRIANLLNNQATRLAAIQQEQSTVSSANLLSEAEQEWLADFEEYIQHNISSDILSVPMLAEEFYMSESSFYRQLKRLSGLSPGQYLMEVRLDKARQLLENNSCRSVDEVASAVGYSDFRSFSRSFKKRFGKLPSKM